MIASNAQDRGRTFFSLLIVVIGFIVVEYWAACQ